MITLDTAGSANPMEASFTGVPLDAGIQPSFSNPMAAEMMRPANEQDAARRAGVERKRRDYMATLDSALLEPDTFFKQHPLDPLLAEDPAAREKLLAAAFTRYHNNGRTVPAGDFGHALMRRDLAGKLFGGAGADDDVAFHGELVKAAQGRKDDTDLRNLVSLEAAKAAAVSVAAPGEIAGTWSGSREKFKSSPAWKPGRDPQIFTDFEEARSDLRGKMEPFAEPLQAVYSAFRAKSGVRNAAYDAYAKLPDAAERKDFITALRVASEALPEAEKKEFWANLKQQVGRDVGSFAEAAATTDYLDAFVQAGFGEDTSEARQKRDLQEDLPSDFVRDILRVEQTDFDKIDWLTQEGSWARVAESAAYAAPGAFITTTAAAVPVVGLAAFAASSYDNAYQEFRGRFEAAGDSYEVARDKARALAPSVMIPEMLMERLQIKAFAGQLPLLEKAMQAATGRMKSATAQLLARTTVGAAEEGVQEQWQGLLPDFVQNFAHELGMEVSSIDWMNGKNGVFDGYWKDSAQNILVMMPIAILLGGKGVIADRSRIEQLRQATDTQLMAAGANPEDISNFRMANGMGQQVAALDGMLGNLEPQSETARTAVEQLLAQSVEQKRAVEDLAQLGYSGPKIISRPDGSFGVYDGRSGEEVGSAADLNGVRRLVSAHTAWLDDASADQMTALATLLSGSQKLSKGLGVETEFDLGKLFNRDTAEVLGPRFVEQYDRQLELQEQADGGSGAVTRNVIGLTIPEQRNGVATLVTKIFKGGTLPTVFHEDFHVLHERARAAGTITREDDIALLRSHDTILAGRTTNMRKSEGPGTQARFIPEGMTDAEIPDTLLNEAIGEIGEMEVFRTAKRGASRLGVSRGTIGSHIGAVARLEPGVAGKFKAFFAAVKARWGLAMSRAYLMKKAEAAGHFDPTTYNAYLDKLMGLDRQKEHDARVVDEFKKLLDNAGPQFALGPVGVAQLDKKLFDRIGDDALRVEQPKARYEDKRQLLLDFSESIVGDPKESAGARADIGTLGALQVIRQRLALDLAENLKVGFIGESVHSPDDLARLAQALRNPRFETFYVLAAKYRTKRHKAGEGWQIVDAMAITSRVPCSANIGTGVTMDQNVQEHGDFLRRAKATDYFLIHNHPSGDPSPSTMDVGMTRGHTEKMKAAGFSALGHLVINHLTFTNIDPMGGLSQGTIPGGAVDPYAWPLLGRGIGMKADSPEEIALVARSITSGPVIQSDSLLGLIVDARLKVVGMARGSVDDFLRLTPQQLQDYARTQGGCNLMIYGAAADGAAARGLLHRLRSMNVDNLLMEAVIEHSGSQLLSGIIDGSFRYSNQVGDRFFGGERGAKGVRVQEDSPSFALGPANMAGIMSGDALSRIKDPRRLAQVMSRISRDFQELQVRNERQLLLSTHKQGKGELKRAAMLEEARLREEYVGEAYSKHQGVMDDADLIKIKSQPGHALLASPDTPLRGRLMSKRAAIDKHPAMFQVNRPGEYDGAEGISRSVFGGTLMPDQAAQELFDAHLIKEPTADAMWALLHQEQAGVAKMKDAMRAAQDDVRAAKLRAKQEANMWLEERGGDQAANFSQKDEILRSLAMLDAITGALPNELAGKLGGHTQLARIESDEAKLRYLKDKLALADKGLKGFLKQQYGVEFEKLLKRSRPEKDEEGKRPSGRIGADMHDLFRSIEHAMGLDAAGVEARVAELESLLQGKNISAEQEAHINLEIGMVSLCGNWNQADAARREMALNEALRLYEGGYMGRLIEVAKRREQRAKGRATARTDTGKAGTAGERDTKILADNGFKGGWVGGLLSCGSFDQVLTYIFGDKSKLAQTLVDRERWCSQHKTDAILQKTTALEAVFTRLAGGSMVKGQQMQWAMHQKTIPMGDRIMSPLEIITATLMWKQEDGQRHMQGHLDDAGKPVGEWHYDQSWIDEAESKLDDNARAVRLHLMEEYGREYDRINAVFRDLYGVNLPRHAFYSPLSVKPVSEQAGQVVDPVSGFGMQGLSMTPGSLRNRSQTAIAEPAFEDAAQIFIGHTKQMEHFIAYGKFTQDIMGIMNSRDVLNSVEAKGGKAARAVLKNWVDFFAQGGNRDAGAQLGFNQVLSRMTGRAASSILIGRASVIAIQTVQLGAGLAEMPAAAFIKRLAKLMTGQMGWGEAIQTGYIQRRFKELPVMVRLAVDGLAVTKPTQLRMVIQKLGGMIGGMDALCTSGTYAMIYDYQLGQGKGLGMDEAQASAYAHQAAERGCDRVAQPTRPGTRSMVENRSNVYTKLVWAFASEARQKIALSGFTLANPDASLGRKARAIAVTWLVGGLIVALIRAAKRDLLDGGDDDTLDEKNWDLGNLAIATLCGPLGGVPVLGQELERAIYGGAGVYAPSGGLFSNIGQAGKALGHVGDWGEKDTGEIINDVDKILSGLALGSDRMAEYSSLMHMAKDLFSLSKQATGE